MNPSARDNCSRACGSVASRRRNLFQFAVTYPLDTAMAGFVRGLLAWQRSPLGCCPESPQNAIEHGTGIPPARPTLVPVSCRLQNRFQDRCHAFMG